MKTRTYSLVAILLITFLIPSLAQADTRPYAVRELPNATNKMDASLEAQVKAMQSGEMTTVIVTLRQQADLSRGVPGANRAARQQGVIRALQAISNASQRRITGLLNSRKAQGSVKDFEALWVFNGFSVTGTSAVINELSQNPDVYSISSDDLEIVPAFAPAEANISLVNAPALWSLGYSGQGMVVANMDSGVDINHPDLSTRWRGGSNSWFDPYGQHPVTPTDLSGHGTWTMGTMVGGDAGGTTVGVAPNAQWIAVKIFNDSGSSTATAIHQGFQWLLDPDGNPNTADAPNVVNNSWTYANQGCYLDFEPDLQALRAAGILPIFAAGNGGPYGSTSYSPSNNPSAFAVGAINNNSQIYGYSSRGPTTCGGSIGPFPELVAPGVNVRTSDLYNGYYNATGTSLAAPHIAGGLALILSAQPNLSAVDQGLALINSAVDLGASGPDDTYGYGRLDLLAAFNWLAGNPTSTPAPTSTSTSLPAFTSTAVPTSTSTSLPAFTSTALPTYTPTSLPTNTPTPLPSATPTSFTDLIFVDGFESGNLLAWSSNTTDGGDLGVSLAAALTGTYGLQAVVDDNNPIFVTDDSPNVETRYRARYYFDPNSITMTSGNAHYIFYGFSGTTTQVLRVEFRFSQGSYQVRTALRNDGSGWINSSWFTISDASHFIELDWRAATASGANNGGLTLWIDGAQRANLTGVDNDTRRIDRVQMGAIAGIDTGTRGTYYFDGLESHRQTYIGP